ncbi:MAG: cobyrinic acid a,c-diamide synthase, partial [Oscillospiraceae bacterium]|nr:cobyrinic acid a,c-diamide synthase [Oscillospiraceae bacterium]
MNRFLIAGTGSGCGKTTMTCAILSALQIRGRQVSAFKCGPDYIDP